MAVEEREERACRLVPDIGDHEVVSPEIDEQSPGVVVVDLHLLRVETGLAKSFLDVRTDLPVARRVRQQQADGRLRIDRSIDQGSAALLELTDPRARLPLQGCLDRVP